MKNTKKIEFLTGFFSLLAFFSLLFVMLKASNLNLFQSQDGYRVVAYFDQIGGLRRAAPVTLAGVRIGEVEEINLDPQTFQAQVAIRINKQFDTIPIDSSVSILTSGILGEKYIGITAGGEEEYIGDGDSIDITQSALVLENLISSFLNR